MELFRGFGPLVVYDLLYGIVAHDNSLLFIFASIIMLKSDRHLTWELDVVTILDLYTPSGH